MQICFVTANYVARAAGYALRPFQWGEAERITVQKLSLADLDAMYATITRAGFTRVEIWQAHAWPLYVTPAWAEAHKEILARHGLTAIGYAGGLSGAKANPQLTRAKFETARLLGLPLITGGTDAASVPFLYELAREFKIHVAIENHPEKHPDEVVAKIGEFGEWIGAGVDTGWFATQGYSPAEAIRALAPHLRHIHLKDIRQAGAHETVPLGDGVADIAGCVKVLKELGYDGTVTIEHEPEDHDPTEECAAGIAYLQSLLG